MEGQTVCLHAVLIPLLGLGEVMIVTETCQHSTGNMLSMMLMNIVNCHVREFLRMFEEFPTPNIIKTLLDMLNLLG